MKNILAVFLLTSMICLSGLTDISWAENKPLHEVCPQERKTAKAPNKYLKKVNPLRNEPRHIKKGKVLAHIKAKPLACKHCHGMAGSGNGSMAISMNPKPRNFTCKQTMKDISDGQLFWVIKNGSKGTAMQAYSYLSDKKIWQLVHYIRSLSNSTS